MYNVISRRTVQQNKLRHNAAAMTKFEFLLSLSKPVIPLCCLVVTGQVFNGLIPSLIVGHTLRQWVPPITSEALHLVVLVFGILHTVIGVSEGQVVQAAEQGSQVIPLTWEYGFRDVITIANLAMLGAAFSCYCSNGNEPGFVTTFGAGVALRMLAVDVIPYAVTNPVQAWLHSMKVVLANAEGVATRCGGGVGDCAGGPFRMLFGSYSLEAVQIGTLVLRFYLMLLPLLYTSQWSLRTLLAARKLSRGKTGAQALLIKCFVLSMSGAALCYALATLPLNGVNGSLSNFVVAIVVGCVCESLLSLYEVVQVKFTGRNGIEAQGMLLQLFFFLVFIGL